MPVRYSSSSSDSQSFRIERNFIYKWKINQFCCQCLSFEEVLPSTKFSFDFGTGLKFIGELSIGAFGSECTFTLTSPTHEFWKVCVMLWLGEQRPQYQTIYTLNQFCNSIKMKLTNILINYSWTSIIMCEIIFVDYMRIPTPTFLADKGQRFANDFFELFKSKKYSDVTLYVDGFEFPVHKCILASRSKVFAAMFEHDMEESKTNKVIISDIEFEVFIEVLRYIYTDQVANLDELATDLLVASDIYDLQNLKSLCEIELTDDLKVENAADALTFAHFYEALELKKNAMHFIRCNTSAVEHTEGWQHFMTNYSFLFKELFP